LILRVEFPLTIEADTQRILTSHIDHLATMLTSKQSNVLKAKVQPWRAVWPANKASASAQFEMKKQGGGIFSQDGFNDKGECIPSDYPSK